VAQVEEQSCLWSLLEQEISKYPRAASNFSHAPVKVAPKAIDDFKVGVDVTRNHSKSLSRKD
jgi:hypothetical protein